MVNCIICGDLHGDQFWKNGLDYFYSHPECKFVFLGDYLDPYTRYEGITHEDAYNNLLEVLEFARNNRDRVILLWGNHDRFYDNRDEECCRHDYKNYTAIVKLFKDNEDLFQFAYREGDYLFTHAGVCSGWLKYNGLTTDVDELVDYLNTNPNSLWQVGAARGGRYGRWGSPLWCCWLGEWYYDDCQNPLDIKQIIGHTNVGKGTYMFDEEKKVYMMDVQNCFLLKDEEFILLSPEN